ncbi:MAG: L,D-transpeptidase family protein [Fretibacterium sp.]|nr:L,D-transpeptidase family protein [Fretibacterium sp.]
MKKILRVLWGVSVFSVLLCSVVLAAAPSPGWVADLKAVKDAEQIVIVSGTKGSNADFSMHEKDEDGQWHQVLSAQAYIGKKGWGKKREGDGKTPVGVFRFTMAFGIKADPGCPMGYTQVDDTHYWNGDSNSPRYNQFVSTRDGDKFSRKSSEHIVDYTLAYPYVLNISYNEEGTPNRGSAIFLHCYTRNHYTAGCVAIPEKVMIEVLKRVKDNCVVVMDQGKNIRRY